MNIIQVELRNKNALSILKGLEKAKIIKLVKSKKLKESSPDQYKGVFSRERALEMIQQVDKSRNEWGKRTI
ncbi:MAG TPA: hypothetical protein VFD91_08110 [Mariniphaga sp.]|nr:hypothetical protein [Mariniphaga sp.]